ncbi:MAG: tetratricopeptide repeat protein [Candidatus Riflebacteria bacterium]|nr:tetratricopeptide repeat protein [Candidatus Riflebacteria bacterium]
MQLQIRKLIVILFICSLSSIVLAQGTSGSGEALIKRARDHINLFQYDSALTLLRQAAQLEPDNWEPFFLAGSALLRQKKAAEAESFLVKAHQLNANDLEVQKALGALYISLAKDAQNAGKTQAMNDYLHKACRAYPGGTKIWQTLLETWWNNGEYDKIKEEGELIVKGNSTALDQGDDKSLQTALVIVAKAYYRENDFAGAEKYLTVASRIRYANDDLYSMKREIRNRSEESLRKVVDEANKLFKEGNYGRALELLQTTSKMPGSKSGEISELIERIEKEATLMQSLAKIDDLIRAEKFAEALEPLQEISANYPGEERVGSRLKKVSARVNQLQAEQAKVNAAQIADKNKQREFNRQFNFFLKEAGENEKRGSYDIAVISYEKALKMQPENKDIPAKIQELKKKSVQSKQRQDNFSVSFADFENSFKVNDYAAAYSKGKALIEEFEEHRSIVAPAFAESCLRMEKFDEARSSLTYIETVEEHKNIYNYVKGMIAYNQGDNNLALEHFSKLKSGFRSDITSTMFWIYLYKFQMGIYIIMLAMLFPAIKTGKEMLSNWKSTSMLRKIDKIKESGDYVANLAFLQERYDREDIPNSKQVAVMLAEALLRTGNPQRAYELVSALLKKDTRNPNARRIAGEACLQLEDTSPTGLEHIQGLLKIDETRKEVISYLAQAYIRQQADHKMAQDYIMKAISINPNDNEAIVYLADTYIKRQTYSQQSFKTLERAIKIAPEVPAYYEAIIENLHRLDNPQEAEKWREMAASRFPSEPAFSDQPRKSSRVAQSPSPASLGSMPDYESIGNDAPGGFPDYENIGNNAPGGFPDYENIGNTSPGGFPDYENIGNDSSLPNIAPAPLPDWSAKPTPKPSTPAISGPQKSCPHCQAINALKEYYCTTCGKPFGG